VVKAQGLESPETLELPTPHGPARARLHAPVQPQPALVLGHGAGGGIGAPDLVAAAAAATALAVSVVLVEQPYRVAGRRSPAPARQLDAAFIAVITQLREGPLRGLPVITGGRSSGGRVACRTAAATGAAGVVCLAFPLLAPARGPDGERPSRAPELDAVTVPTLIVQGASDPFGMPAATSTRTVVRVPGDHSLRRASDQVTTAVHDWLSVLVFALR
jgi:predicted alpha/beta-hydrolase family hydrolase